MRSGTLDSSPGVLHTGSGVLNFSAGPLDPPAGVLNFSNGVLHFCSGVLDLPDGVLNSANGVPNKANGVIGIGHPLFSTRNCQGRRWWHEVDSAIAVRVEFDTGDVLTSVLCSIAAKIVIFASAVWIGCALGAVAIMLPCGLVAKSWDFEMIAFIVASPMEIIGPSALLNVPFLMFAMMYFVFGENAGYRAWGTVVGVESLVVMSAVGDHLHSWPSLGGAWMLWVVLLVMFETGLWFTYQTGVNQWAREIGVLRAGIIRRLGDGEPEERPTISAGETTE